MVRQRRRQEAGRLIEFLLCQCQFHSGKALCYQRDLSGKGTGQDQPLIGEMDLAVPLPLQKAPLGQDAQHPGDGGAGDPQGPGHRRGAYIRSFLGERIDCQQIAQMGTGPFHEKTSSVMKRRGADRVSCPRLCLCFLLAVTGTAAAAAVSAAGAAALAVLAVIDAAADNGHKDDQNDECADECGYVHEIPSFLTWPP